VSAVQLSVASSVILRGIVVRPPDHSPEVFCFTSVLFDTRTLNVSVDCKVYQRFVPRPNS